MGAAVLLCAVAADGSPVPTYPLHRRVSARLADSRPFPARLSGSVGWSASPGSADHTALREALADIATTLASVDREWAAAIIDLSAAPSADRVDAIIDQLTDVVARQSADARANAAALNDLAVAHLARAAERHDPWSLIEALEHLERASQLDSTSDVIRFNEALTLDQLHLFEEAEHQWASYLAGRVDQRWRREAEQRLASNRAAQSVASFSARTPDLEVAATADPQGAREYVLDTLLGTWGAAVVRDARRADTTLVRMRRIGGTLIARSGDSSVAHVALDCATGGSRIGELAALFSRGSIEFGRGHFTPAGVALDSAVRGLRAKHADAIADWGDILIAVTEMLTARHAAAKARLAVVERSAARRQDIALRARALWVVGLTTAIQGNATEGIEYSSRSRALFAAIGERENEGTMLSQAADLDYLLGRDDAWISDKLRAAGMLLGRHSAFRRSNLLSDLGKQLSDVGWAQAATPVLREAVDASAFSPRPIDRTSALINLAHAEFAGGREAAGVETVREVLALPQDAMGDTLTRHAMRRQLELTEAMQTSLAPARADSLLTNAIASFKKDSLRYDVALLLTRRARVRLALHKTNDALADLQDAVRTIESHVDARQNAVAARDAAAVRRDAYQELVSLDLARGDTAAALRTALQRRGIRVPGALPPVPDGTVLITYEVLRDETLLWIRSTSGTRLVRRPTSAREVATLASALETRLRDPRTQDSAGPARALYDLLVAPAEPELHRAAELLVSPDAAIARVPFAALRDARGRYLIEQVAIRSTATATFTPERHVESASAAIIGNPAFDRALFPELPPLAGAAAEARAIAASYPHARVIANSDATKLRATEALQQASIVHFAGHARRVDRAPQLSFLVLAGVAGGYQTNVLTAAELSRLPLSRAALVVLSSCGTAQRRSRRDASSSGLESALLDAGAGAVISSAWEVDDARTGAVMIALHRHLAGGERPSVALRSAQLEMLHAGGEPADPGAWSVFQLGTR